MKPQWAVYSEVNGGWLVDSSFVFSWSVDDAMWFDSQKQAYDTLMDMRGNGHVINNRDVTVTRMR